jgi:hypothetical protein
MADSQNSRTRRDRRCGTRSDVWAEANSQPRGGHIGVNVFSNFRRSKISKLAQRPGIHFPAQRGATTMKFVAMKFLALAAVIAVLVAASAVFVSSHPRAMTACIADCE